MAAVTDSKKEAFRQYLEKAGVIDSLTKVLVSLYEEPDKPSEAINFVKSHLGAPTPEEFEALKAEKAAVEEELAAAQAKIAEMEAAAAAADAPAEPAEGEEAAAE
uniref:Associate of Myc 1 n=1 Tax=Prasinoderma singulare TaxID=676789 RepID=A0A7S3C2L0_9VIRI